MHAGTFGKSGLGECLLKFNRNKDTCVEVNETLLGSAAEPMAKRRTPAYCTQSGNGVFEFITSTDHYSFSLHANFSCSPTPFHELMDLNLLFVSLLGISQPIKVKAQPLSSSDGCVPSSG